MSDELVMERFRLLERIGSGGMGTVYRAFDERLQRQVAVKQLRDCDPDRVMREAQAAARLNHPAIVTLYELGEHEGHAILVSELVPGETLAELETAGDLCDRDVGEIVADLCEALVHAHDRGVVHRDIKPENVIVRELGQDQGRRAKLMDFGIARVAGTPTLTAHGEVVGTLAYMSPEQAEGELAGPPSDIYSLALTAYECWAGANPVATASPAETARRIGEPVPPLRLARPDLPEGLADTVDACLDPDPGLRPTPFELRDCVLAELPDLDSDHALPSSQHSEPERSDRTMLPPVRTGVLVGAAVLLGLIAGPLAAPGLALVLGFFAVPSVLIGASAAGLAVLAAPLLGAIGLGTASAGLGAVGTTPASRALLGVGSWIWMFGGALALGVGPTLGFDAAPHGWISDVSVAADAILRPLVRPESIAGAAIFALAGVALGRLLEMRHAALALLAAMLWAAATNAALALVGDGSLANRPIGIVATAAVAVALEFGLLRPRSTDDDAAAAPALATHHPRKRFAGRLA